MLDAQPWHSTGRQPFVWDLMPQVGNMLRPILRLVVNRQTKITILRKRTARSTIGSQPKIEVYRVQDDALLPDPEQPVIPLRIVESPYIWFEDTELPRWKQDQDGNWVEE